MSYFVRIPTKGNKTTTTTKTVVNIQYVQFSNKGYLKSENTFQLSKTKKKCQQTTHTHTHIQWPIFFIIIDTLEAI